MNGGGESQILLEELRKRGVFEKGFSVETNTDASPYWYGTILNFETLEKELPYIKESRRAKIIEDYKTDCNSPIVRLLGLTLERKWKS